MEEIEIVLESLARGEKEGQIEAAIVLSNLSKRQKQQISDKDLIISSLTLNVTISRFSHNSTCLSALLSLAFGSERVLVEVIEEGSGECKESAVGILLGVCKSDRERSRGLILRGVMPGLLQVSVDGIERGKEMARELLLLLRDCCSDFAMKHSKIEIVQQIMQEIDQEGERVPEVMLKFVEDLISKLTNTIFPL